MLHNQRVAAWVKFKTDMHCSPSGLVNDDVQYRCDGGILIVLDDEKAPSIELLSKISPNTFTTKAPKP